MQTLGDEILLDDTSLLVSETDAKGIIVYADETFVKFSEYALEELIGRPHNMIRHPDMPKAAFKELWATVKSGNVWQGFVKIEQKMENFIGCMRRFFLLAKTIISLFVKWRAVKRWKNIQNCMPQCVQVREDK